MATSTGSAILAMLESDVLVAFGPALLTFLTNVKANPDPVDVGAQWIQLTGSFIGAAPQLEVAEIQQLAATLQAKLQALIAAKTAVPPA